MNKELNSVPSAGTEAETSTIADVTTSSQPIANTHVGCSLSFSRSNNLENEGVLSPEILNAIDLILKSCPNVVFGGSIALNAVGLINRKVSDIDLFFQYNDSLTKNGFLSIENDGQITSDTVTNTNGVEIQRTGAKINGVKTCCFKVDQEELQHSKAKVFGRTICIQNVNYAIQAKIAYSAKNDKHKSDLIQIDAVLKAVP